MRKSKRAASMTLADIALRSRTGASVIAWTHAGLTEANPSDNTRLTAGDIVVLLGSRPQIQQAMGLLVQMGAK